jgi:hypothetical protein
VINVEQKLIQYTADVKDVEVEMKDSELWMKEMQKRRLELATIENIQLRRSLIVRSMILDQQKMEAGYFLDPLRIRMENN